MLKIAAGEFAKIVSGQLYEISESTMIDQIPVINSKNATKNSFFVAFKGEHVDGHDFVTEAINLGAKFALVSKPVAEPHVLVTDTGKALIDLAVKNAQSGDVVLLMGKGHESGQEVNSVVTPFDDRIELAESIRRLAR